LSDSFEKGNGMTNMSLRMESINGIFKIIPVQNGHICCLNTILKVRLLYRVVPFSCSICCNLYSILSFISIL